MRAPAVAASRPPLAMATVSSPTVDPGGSLALSGANSLAYGGRSIEAFLWSQISGPSGSFTLPGSMNTEYTAPLPAGPLTLHLAVTDTFGLSGSATIEISVNNLPPTQHGHPHLIKAARHDRMPCAVLAVYG
jgi:hypothetical protein